MRSRPPAVAADRRRACRRTTASLPGHAGDGFFSRTARVKGAEEVTVSWTVSLSESAFLERDPILRRMAASSCPAQAQDLHLSRGSHREGPRRSPGWSSCRRRWGRAGRSTHPTRPRSRPRSLDRRAAGISLHQTANADGVESSRDSKDRERRLLPCPARKHWKIQKAAKAANIARHTPHPRLAALAALAALAVLR